MTEPVPESPLARRRLVAALEARGCIRSPRVADAFAAVPREAFVPPLPLERVYKMDEAIPTRFDGDGVPVSLVEAYAWYSAAATHGDAGSAQRRDRLAGTLPPSTLREAQARAQQVAATIENSGSTASSGNSSLATGTATKASTTPAPTP